MPRATKLLLYLLSGLTTTRQRKMAEAHLPDKETQFISESQQQDLAMSVAREVNTGTAEVFQLYAREAEQTAQTNRMSNALADAAHKVDNLEGMLRESAMNTEEFTQLLSGAVSAAYALASDACTFPCLTSTQAKEVAHASHINANSPGPT